MAFTDQEVLDAYPRPAIDQDNVEHYRGRLERRLLINRCNDCGRLHHPPDPRCPFCWSESVTATEVSGRGEVYLATVLHTGSRVEGIDYDTGYPLVAVALDDDPRVRFTATVPAGFTCAVGDRVELGWIEREGAPVPAWKPEAGT